MTKSLPQSAKLQRAYDALIQRHGMKEHHDLMHDIRLSIEYLSALERHFPHLELLLDDAKMQKSEP